MRFLIGFYLISGLLFLIQPQHCNANPDPKPGFTKYYKSTYTRYLDHAERARRPQSDNLRLQAVGRLLQDNLPSDAELLLTQIPFEMLTEPLQHEYLLLNANLFLLKKMPYRSLNTLHQIKAPEALLQPQQLAYYSLLAMASADTNNYLASATARLALDPLFKKSSLQQANRTNIWNDLSQLSTGEIAIQMRHADSGELPGWLEIVYISKMFEDDPSLLEAQRAQWQRNNPKHPANSLLPNQHASLRHFFKNHSSSLLDHSSEPLKIAVLLPHSGLHQPAAEAIKAGFMSAYLEHQHEPDAPKDIHFYGTSSDQNIQKIYSQAIKEGANLVVGPLTKQEVEKIESLGSIVLIPTLGLNFTSNAGKGLTNFFEYALSPQDEAQQVAQKIINDGGLKVLAIVPEGEWAASVAKSFAKTLHQNGGQVVDHASYPKNKSLDLTIKHLLKVDDTLFNKLRREKYEEDFDLPRRTDFDSIFIVASPSVARQIKPLLQFYFAEDIPVYSTSEVYSGANQPSLNRDLDGIIFCDIPFNLKHDPQIKLAQKQMQQFAPNLSNDNAKLFAFGHDAYLLATQLYPFKPFDHRNIDGLTGHLYIDRQQILRHLTWAKFTNGVPKLIDS